MIRGVCIKEVGLQVFAVHGELSPRPCLEALKTH